MNPSIRLSQSGCALVALVALVVLFPSAGSAIRLPEELPEAAGERSSSALQVQPSLEFFQPRSEKAWSHPGLHEFFAAYSDRWEIRWDARSDRPHLIQGVGIPLLPGRGNTLARRSPDLPQERALTLGDVERRLREFLARSPDILGIGELDLRLDAASSHAFGGGALWVVEFQQVHQGLPVEGARVFFRINHGNVVQFGSDRVAEVDVDSRPAVSRARALADALAELGISSVPRKVIDPGTLKIYPAMAGHEPIHEPYAGPAGVGYRHRLVWSFEYRRSSDSHAFRLLVDAHRGEVLGHRDLTRYGTVRGDVYPLTNTDPLMSVAFPFATVTNYGTRITDGDGYYTYFGGDATAELDGRYLEITDQCGPISLTEPSPGHLDFDGRDQGTDCDVPNVGGLGNTNAARSAFYHLTNVNRKAAGFFPDHPWLDATLTANTNLTTTTCNAFWNNGELHFYQSGGGCANSGEIAAVLVHEWGHGMDENAGGPATDAGSDEAVADTFAFLETGVPCIGDGFQPGVPCPNCNSTCTGLRDLAAFATGGISTIARPDTVAADAGINCDTWACPFGLGGLSYMGPMGYEGHCESYIASTANWDLAQLLVAAHGADLGWVEMEWIWYGSLTPAGSAYRVVSGGQCNPAAAVDGCGADNWYTVYLATDDDDGNLTNGTPNACRIWDAFDAHGIACGSRPACSSAGNTAPLVTITAPGDGVTYSANDQITFAGVAVDRQDGYLSENLRWSSSIDGVVAIGDSFVEHMLSVGTHTITASVTDTGGIEGSDQIVVTVTGTMKFVSIAAEDGWVRESGEHTDIGGKKDATGAALAGVRAGDNENDRQYKGIVSFDTVYLPDDATIIAATLRLRRGKVVGKNPFETHGTCWVDVETGGFGGDTALAKSDFEASATASQAATLSNATSNGDWSEATLDAAGLLAINKAGITQLRFYFALDDNDDRGIDYIGYHAADYVDYDSHPRLTVTYK